MDDPAGVSGHQRGLGGTLVAVDVSRHGTCSWPRPLVWPESPTGRSLTEPPLPSDASDLQWRLPDDSVRTDVWPDSVQVSGGKLSMRLPTGSLVWLTIGLHPAGHRDEAWLKKGLPCS
jgi:hypothetical protein